MLFKTPPPDFNKAIDVVGCYIEHDGKFVLLHRQPHKSSGDRWGLPAGKVDAGETFSQAMSRETREETGLVIPEDDLTFFRTVYVRHADRDLAYHMFSTHLAEKPNISLRSDEHQAFAWVSPAEALRMNLILDQDACIEMFYERNVAR